jgi:hypothetical protein
MSRTAQIKFNGICLIRQLIRRNGSKAVFHFRGIIRAISNVNLAAS